MIAIISVPYFPLQYIKSAIYYFSLLLFVGFKWVSKHHTSQSIATNVWRLQVWVTMRPLFYDTHVSNTFAEAEIECALQNDTLRGRAKKIIRRWWSLYRNSNKTSMQNNNTKNLYLWTRLWLQTKTNTKKLKQVPLLSNKTATFFRNIHFELAS